MSNWFLVGGAVRDLQLGAEPADMDYVYTGNYEDMMTGIRARGITVYLEKPEFQTARVKSEKYGAVDIQSAIELFDNLGRRDFTINAMAYSEATGELYDPYGGLDDLRKFRLQTVKSPSSTFINDPVRILRMLRFAIQYGLAIDPNILAVARSEHLLKSIQDAEPQRVRNEFEKLFKQHPAQVTQYLTFLGQETLSAFYAHVNLKFST